MKTATLHVTDLDSLRWYKKLEDMEAAELVGRLRRTTPPEPKMLAGTAWHAILENPPVEIERIKCGGFTFRVDCETSLVLPQIREVRACKYFEVGDVMVKLTGKVDGISGNVVTDHKLTFNSNPENYLDAYQWRAYLDIFDADKFTYVIYDAKEDESGEIVIRDVSTLDLYRYPEMERDLFDGVAELLEFVKAQAPDLIGN